MINEPFAILFIFIVFVIILISFACMLKNKYESLLNHESFTNEQNIVDNKMETIKYNELVTSLNDWGLHVNKLIFVNKIIPSFGFIKIREYVNKCVDNEEQRDSQQIMNDIRKQIKEQEKTEGFIATFEETELINELNDIIKC